MTPLAVLPLPVSPVRADYSGNTVCLFNDAVSSSDFIASNDRMINEKWIGKDVEGSGRGII
jgi:hypothetical protein